MKANQSVIAAAILAIFTAGASATHLTLNTSAATPVARTQADEGVPHNLVTAMAADEGVPRNLVTAMVADEGVPHNLVTAFNAEADAGQRLTRVVV